MDRTHTEAEVALLAGRAAWLDLPQDVIVVRDMHERIVFWNRGAGDRRKSRRRRGVWGSLTIFATLEAHQADLSVETRRSSSIVQRAAILQ